jgi:hypothetical protein
MTYYDYRWATGHDVALASLTNVENDLATYAVQKPFAIRSQPVNTFSQVRETLDGYVIMDGLFDHTWQISALTRAGVKYIEDTYMTSNESTAITIYTRRHNRESYTRYNAYIKPFTFGDDIDYQRNKFVNITLTFTNLSTPNA